MLVSGCAHANLPDVSTLKTRKNSLPIVEIPSVILGKTTDTKENTGLWKKRHCLHQGLAVDFADVHIKGNDQRSSRSLLGFEAFHEMVEERFSGRRRKKTFENYVKCRKNTGEQKQKHQNSRVWLETLKGECPQTVSGKLCLFWCWCDRAGLIERRQE